MIEHSAKGLFSSPFINALKRFLPRPFIVLAFGAVFLNTAFTEETLDPASGVREIIIVFKTHFDIGYTDLAEKVVDSYRTTMIDKALDVCEQNKQLPPEKRFVWTLPGWPMEQIIGDKQTPDRRARILEEIKDGRFVFHALPFTLHTESLDLEDLVRGLDHASHIAREMGLELPRDAKMTDVPSHSWILPTLLCHAGVDFLHLGCNAASASPEVPPLFWWEGPDGSKLLTMYTAASYGTDLIPSHDWPYPVWLALIHTGDNHGPPKPEEVAALLEKAAKSLPNVKVRIGRLSDFSDALKEYKIDIPTVRGDMPDTWIHGVMSMPLETSMARRERPLLPAWESLNTLLRLWGIEAASPEKSLDKAYEESLLFGEHTWGMDVKRFGPRRYGQEWENTRATGKYQKLEDSWEEKGNHIREMDRLLKQGLDENLSSLAKNVGAEGQRMVVFNPLPWPRDGVVSVEAMPDVPSALKDADSGEILPVEKRDNKLRFIARAVPAMGYRTYQWAASPPENGPAPTFDPATNMLQNEFYQITLEPANGAILSLIDKRTGQEWVRPGDAPGFGQYLYERFSDAETQRYYHAYAKVDTDWALGDFGKPGLPPSDRVGYASEVMTSCALDVQSGPCSVSVTMSVVPAKARAAKIAITFTLYQGLPYLDMTWRIENKKADPWPEAGWLCLPFNIDKPRFLLGRLGGIVEPEKEVIRGANHDIYCINTGLAILDDTGKGVGVCPLDTPLVSLERPGLWRYSRDFLPTQAKAYVNLFNNQWSTNFQQWTEGTWDSDIRCWSFGQYAAEADLITPAEEARAPLLAAVCSGPAGKLPIKQNGLVLSRKGVLVTAFGFCPGDDSVLLRLWEQTGASGACEVQVPAGFGDGIAQPCDLRGRPQGAALPIKEGRFTAGVSAYAPVNMRLTKSAK